MSILRRLILALALSAGLSPAFAQVPPPVPALPDTERRTSYSVSGTTCACSVGFALYGDSTDYQNWVEVYLNGTRVNFNDATFGWRITSPSGSLGSIALPITNAVLTFTNVQTGVVQIVGARRPRRVSQFSENAGVSARNLNQALTDIIAQNRELWDKTNDITGRALISQPGVTLGLLPIPSVCASGFLGFDSSGLIPVCRTGTAGGNVTLPVVSGDLAIFDGTTGLIKDSGSVPTISCTALGAFPVGSGSSTQCSTAAGAQAVINNVVSVPAVVGGSAPGSTFIVSSTTSGAPSGDTIAIEASSITLRNILSGASLVNIGVSGTTGGSVFIAGGTSGGAKFTVPAVAGTPTLTIGSSSGTPAVTASSPLVITTATGNITCTTCGVTGSPLSQFASTTSSQLAGVISDETGSGTLVFGTGPTLTSPTIAGSITGGGTGITVFVNGSTGNDSNNCLTSGTSCLTVQAAWNKAVLINNGTGTLTLAIADGTYTNSATPGQPVLSINGTWIGGGTVTIQGDCGTPANVILNATSANTIQVANAAVNVICMRLKSTTAGDELLAYNNGIITGQLMDFNTSAGSHITANAGGRVSMIGNYSITGSAVSHVHAFARGYISLTSGVATLTGTPAFSSYFAGVADADIGLGSFTFSGSATGPRFLAHDMGRLDTGGVGCNSLPGNSNGSYDTWGQCDGVFSGSGQLTSTATTGTAPFVVASTTLVSNLHAATADGLTTAPLNNVLGSNTAMGKSPTYTTGPTVAQGTSGTWFASGTVTMKDTGAAASFACKLWDGTTIMSTTTTEAAQINGHVVIALSGFLASPASNINIACTDFTATTGEFISNDSGNSKDSSLTVVRIQ